MIAGGKGEHKKQKKKKGGGGKNEIETWGRLGDDGYSNLSNFVGPCDRNRVKVWPCGTLRLACDFTFFSLFQVKTLKHCFFLCQCI